ncbi:MAG: phage tail protein [Rivularia sp. (in: cyanobacteria)]
MATVVIGIVVSVVLSYVAGLLFAPDAPKTPSPDLPGSEFGRAIPVVFGIGRVGINWIAPATVDKVFRKAGKQGGGKGGGGGGGNIYRSDLLGIVCEGGETGIEGFEGLKINGELLPLGHPASGNELVFFLGDSEQQPWSKIQAKYPGDPVGNIGYRSLALAGFNDYYDENVGNGIPAITVAKVQGFFREVLGGEEQLNVKNVFDYVISAAGIESGDYINEIPNYYVRGYLITRNGESYYDSIQGLLQVSFSYVTQDLQGRLAIRSFNRGAIPVATYSIDDLIPFQSNGGLVSYSRAEQTPERIPGKFTLKFLGYNTDEERESVTQYGVKGNRTNDISLDVPVVLTSDQASSIAKKLILQQELLLQNQYKAILPSRFLGDFVIGDYVVIDNIDMQITKKDKGADCSFAIEAVPYQLSIYDNDYSFPTSPRTEPVREDTTSIPTELYIVESPLVRDFHPEIGFYLFCNKPNATIFMSADSGSTFSPIGSVSDAAYIGDCTSILGGGVRATSIDRVNTLTITFTNGDIDALTQEQFLGNNTLLYIAKQNIDGIWEGELIAYQDALLISGTTYQISILKRGLQGTEKFINTHTAGEKCFVMISPEFNAQRVEGALNLLNNPLQFKIQEATWQDFASLPAFNYTPIGRSLEPFAPSPVVSFRDTSNDDLVFLWWYRGRYNNQLRNGGNSLVVDGVLLTYRFRIYNGLSVIRVSSFDSIPASGYRYTAEQQIEDFGSIQDTVTVDITQVSQLVAEGFVNLTTVSPREYRP